MRKKNTVLFNWAVSYAVILLVPLITIFANYYHNTAIIKDEIMQANELILKNLKDNVDRVLEDEREMYIFFSTQKEFQQLVSATEMDWRFYEKVAEFSARLADYGRNNDEISYWMYMEDKDYLINNGSGGSSRNIYYNQKTYMNEEKTYEQWTSLMHGQFSNDFFVYDGFYKDYGKRNLIYANSYNLGESQKVNIFVSLPISLIEQFANTLPEGSMFIVYFGDKREDKQEKFLVVSSSGMTELPENVDITPIVDGKKTFDVIDYTGLSTTAQNGKAVYALLVPEQTFWNDLRYSRNMHFAGLVITLLLGIGLIRFLLKKNYRPVSGLLELIDSEEVEGDVFQQIKIAYHMMQQEKDHMHKTIQIQEKNLISSYLLSRLKGRVIEMGKSKWEKVPELFFKEGSIALVGFYLPHEEGKTVQNDELSFFIVDNVFSELMEDDKFYRAEDGRFIYYLFCVSPAQEEQWKEKCLKNVNFLCDFVDEHFKLNILAAISSVEPDIERLKYLYQNVMEAFEYKMVIGGDDVITTDELQDISEKEQFHEFHIKLTKALEKGDEKEAHRVSKQLFLHTEHTPFIVTRIKVLEAFQVVVDCYNTYITGFSMQKQFLGWMDKLLNAGDRKEMQSVFEDMLEAACDKIGAQGEMENRGIVRSIQEYVQANYTDSSLNVNFIAEKMNRNPVYISKIYKEDTGEGILDYLNALRIKKAQELLRKGGVSVEDVGAMVGYATTRTFRRSFTKIVGVTPKSFCEQEGE